MATLNPFDLLGDNDNDDPSQLIESVTVSAQLLKVAPKKTPDQTQGTQQKQAKLPTKPLPPAQAVQESKNETSRGGSRGGRGGRDFGHGGFRGHGGSYNGDYSVNDNALSNTGLPGNQGQEGEAGNPSERRSYGGPRGPYRGGRRGGFNNEEGTDGERPRRLYERRSGTGRGDNMKREGSGRGNWGTPSDEIAPGVEENENNLNSEKIPDGEDVTGQKEGQADEAEEIEPEDKEMTLEEYEKLVEEKRKALLALKPEQRKVEVDKELKSMQQLSNKKDDDDDSVFIKLGTNKDKKKEISEKEKAKKSVNINEFLKPPEGEKFYNPAGRGRGRGGRGPRGGSSGGGYRNANIAAPSIEDPGQFPTLGGK